MLGPSKQTQWPLARLRADFEIISTSINVSCDFLDIQITGSDKFPFLLQQRPYIESILEKQLFLKKTNLFETPLPTNIDRNHCVKKRSTNALV